jgi:hypothetical protein
MTTVNYLTSDTDLLPQGQQFVCLSFLTDKENNKTLTGLKVRGVYDTHKEASVRAQVLRRKDPSFNVFVGQVGYWLPWDPECESIAEQEFQENQLNELVKKYN